MTPELDWLKRWSELSPQAVALVDGDSREKKNLTYSDLYRQSQTVAQHLSTHFGVQSGDRVAVLAHNDLEYIVLFFALQRLNAILVPINTRFTSPEVNHILNDCGAKLLVLGDGLLLAKEFKTPIWNFSGEKSLKDVCAKNSYITVPFRASFEDICLILYTSGTTGFPKGAMISHRMIFWNSINTGLRLNLTQSEVVVTFLPLFHTGGWNVLTTPCLHRGAKTILLRKFDADRILQICQSEKVSVLFGVPTTMDFMARRELFAKTDLSSVRYAIVGGEPMPIPLIEIWENRGIPIRQGYGLTEFGPNVFSLNEQDSRRKSGSIGFANFYVDTKVEVEGRTARPGEVGELLLKGPMMMSGYWNNIQATAEVIRSGWLHTGDLVRFDDEGFFYVVGRKKEMYISGGENVYPAEVEKVLRTLPGVREAAVIGVPHPTWGEAGKAFITLETPAHFDVLKAREHCLKALAKFKVPMEYVVMKELPKTESGKIAKKLLR